MKKTWSGAVALITGGTGSFGHTMTRYLLDRGCDEVRIYSRDEAKQDAMRNELGPKRLKFYIGDVRDIAATARAMRGANYVFHAAALKQVPSCEFFPLEAVQTNVLGSANVIRSAVAAGVESIVCLSTDKAVEPVNAMGMSKALMEKLLVAEARSIDPGDTVVSCVRYGNVLYSRGSVVPLFMKQAAVDVPITVTDRRMTRFMMNLDEAVGLVEFAFVHAAQGDLFVRKSPGALMVDVAAAVQTLLQRSNAVETIGIRHGEKLHETLATAAELRRSEDCGDYLRIPMDDRDLDYSKYFVEGDVEPSEVADLTSDSAPRLSADEIQQLLMKIPEVAKAVSATGGAR